MISEEWTRLLNHSCDTPVLFIRGTRSDYINEKDKQIIKNVFPKSKLIELDAGHWVHQERLDEFVKMTVDFLKLK